MNKANLFIVGAPKCGTSAMHYYLSQHKDIFMSKVKEPKYFSDDLSSSFRIVKDSEQYKNLFNTDKTYKYYGEASPIYLYSQNAIKKIYEYNKDAKIIVMLRKPSEMIASSHNQLLYNLNENERSLEKAWALEELRRNGQKIPPKCKEVKLLYYSEIAKFGDQLERLYKYFDKKQVFIVFHEDLSKNVQDIYIKILNFLEVDSSDISDISFEVVNRRKDVKSLLLSRFINSKFNKTLNKSKKKLGLGGFNILNKIKKANTKIIEKAEINHKIYDEIAKSYKDDIEKLEFLTSRDLNAWK